MKKCNNTKNGFTLIELIVVVVLLGIIGTIVAVSLGKNNEKQKSDNWNQLVDRIKSAATSYIEDNNVNLIYEKGGYNLIPIDDLVENGLIDETTLIDPRDKNSLSEKEDSYNYVKVYLNESESLEFEYPLQSSSYLSFNPLNITLGLGEEYNYSQGITANNENGIDNNPSYSIIENAAYTIDTTNKIIKFNDVGKFSVAYVYDNQTFYRFFEAIPLDYSYKDPGQYNYKVLATADYLITVSGAQGNGPTGGGRGGQISANVHLKAGTIVNIIVGAQQGTNFIGGTGEYNGGGSSQFLITGTIFSIIAGGGGGITHNDANDYLAIGGGGNGEAGGTGATAGLNGSGGGSTKTTTYDCECGTCGGECIKRAATYECNCQTCGGGCSGGGFCCGQGGYGCSPYCCFSWAPTFKCNCKTCGGACTKYSDTYPCNCETCTNFGKPGYGGKNQIIEDSKVTYALVSNENGVKGGSGEVSIKYILKK